MVELAKVSSVVERDSMSPLTGLISHRKDEENQVEAAQQNCILLKKHNTDNSIEPLSLAEETILDSVPLDDTEAISNSTFRCLIEDAAKEGGAVIIARLQTRDKANFRKKYFHHFYGPNLVKILFRVFDLPGRQILQSRYH